MAKARRASARVMASASASSHAAAAAAARGLDHHRIADRRGDPADRRRILRQGALGAGNARHAGRLHGALGGDLVTHGADRGGAGPDEGESAGLHSLGKGGILGEKAVAGMDRLGAGGLGREEVGGRVEVAARRRCRADAHRLVGEPDISCGAVGLGMDDHGLELEQPAGAKDAKGDFAAIGDQHLVETPLHGPIWIRTCPGSTSSPFSTAMAVTVPALSAVMALNDFIASTRQSVSPTATRPPTCT